MPRKPQPPGNHGGGRPPQRGSSAGSRELYKAKKLLWSEPGVDNWLKMLSSVAPATNWKRSDAKTIKALCPFHSETVPSFSISLEKGNARCFGCREHYTDPIALLAAVGGISYKSAFDRILQDLPNVPRLLKSEAENVRHKHDYNELKNYIARVAKECLQDAKSARASKDPVRMAEYAYAEATLKWLDTREIPEEYWETTSMGLFPTERHLEQYFTGFLKKPELIKDAKNYLSSAYDNSTGHWYGSLVFIYHSSPTQVSRFKIRKPTAEVIEDGKFTHIEMFIKDDESKSEGQGYFGLDSCQGLRTEGLVVYVVEGEFDQISIQLASLGAFAKKDEKVSPHREIVIATGGSYNQSLDELQDLGFLEVRIVSDHPDQGGINFTKELIRGTTVPLNIEVYTWPAEISVKDPDLAIHMADTIGPKMFLSSIYNKDNFQSSRTWFLHRLEEEVSEFKRGDNEVYKIQRLEEYSNIFRSSPEQKELFIREACERLGINESIIKRNLIQNADEDVFVEELVKQILQEYIPIGTKVKENTGAIVLWNKSTKMKKELMFARTKDTASLVALDRIGDLVEWARAKVGLPRFLLEDEQLDPSKPARKRGMRQQEEDMTFYFNRALARIAGSIPPISSLSVKKAGIHIIKNSNGQYVIYFNNATKLYEGTFPDVNEPFIEWKDLDNPTVNSEYYFEFERIGWSANKDISDLKRGEEVNLRNTFDLLVKIINEGWSFENGYLDAWVLAAFIMIIPICDAFDKRPAMFVTAERSSGKSKLTLGLFGGVYPSIPGLIEHCVSSANMSPASIYQDMDGSSKLFIGDEFEEGSYDANSYAKIWQVLRSSSDGGYITRGSNVKRDPVKYFVKFPFILSAINLTSDAANISRLIPIIMKHSLRHIDPSIALSKKWSSTFFNDLKKSLTVAALPHVPDIMRRYYHIKNTYITGEAEGQQYGSRFLDVILPILALLDHIGYDHKRFLNDYAESKTRYMEQMEESDTDQILKSLLYSSYKFGADINGGEPTTLYHILQNKHSRGSLNSTSCGVKFFSKIPYKPEHNNWLVVHWNTVLRSLLRGDSKHGSMTAASLKDQSMRSGKALKDEVYTSAVNFRKVNKLGGNEYSPSQVTVYDITHILEQIDPPDKPEGYNDTPTKSPVEESLLRVIDDPKNTM